MATEKPKQPNQEPEGLGEHNLGPTGEAAQQQGWDINEEQRTQQPSRKPEHYGGQNYNYGARDFGDTPEDMSQMESSETRAGEPNGRKLEQVRSHEKSET